MGRTILKYIGAGKSYNDGVPSAQVLNRLGLEVAGAEGVNIIGSSGNGEPMLLHLLGGLDMPSEDKVVLTDQGLGGLNQKQLGELCNRYLGFMYRFHHLLPKFSALENATMPLLIDGMFRAMTEEKAVKMLKKVDLGKRMLHHPSELSGDERQRVAAARALVNEPKCLLADEPTGDLGRKNAQNVLGMILDLKRELNTSLIVVTHDDELAERFDQVVAMKDGSLQVLQ